jgi:hypothetical protein
MKPRIEETRLAQLESIKKNECPACGGTIKQDANPKRTKKRGPFNCRDFYCQNKKCGKIWRVPRVLYEAAFGKWSE